MAATFSSSRTSYIALGEALDKQLCFHQACSLAVLDAAADAELALAAFNVALREAHRCSRSTLLLQPQQLQPCPAVPNPRPHSFTLQMQRVQRPLPLPRPHHKQPLLMAEAGGNVDVLADALTRQLLQRRGCASVFIRHGRGVAVAMAAIAKARGLLSSLYSRDCTVFSMWKGAAPEGQRLAAAAAAAAADDDNIDEEGELLLAAGEVADAAMQVAAGGSKYTQQQQQQQMQKEDDEGLEVDAGLMLGDVQQQQHYWVPRQVNKLLVIACDPGDSMTAGWGQQTPLHSKTRRLRQQRQRQGEAEAGDGS